MVRIKEKFVLLSRDLEIKREIVESKERREKVPKVAGNSNTRKPKTTFIGEVHENVK